jgi:regulator of protease activity HflC (stomatin/prohibitin superfamily)
MESENRYQFNTTFGLLGYVIIIVVVLIAIFTAVFFLTMWVNVPVGNAVVLVDPLGGTISEPVLGPTFVTKAPWVNAVQITVSVDSLGMWGDGNDPTADFPTVKSFSRDQLEMKIDVTIRWKLDTTKVNDLYENLPQKKLEKRYHSIYRKRTDQNCYERLQYN